MPIQPQRSLFAFGENFLVVCPQCSRRAVLTRSVGALQTAVTLNCVECDCAQQWQQSGITLESTWHWFGDGTNSARMGMPVRTGFGGAEVHLWVETSPDPTVQWPNLKLKLWLQSPCQGENLWFFGDEHLVFLRNYLDYPVENHRVYFSWKLEANREKYRERVQWIEPWLMRAQNRDAALQSIKELRRKLGTPL